ncbi:hypothetical protein, partial [Microcoleus sp. PH2017_25_DOB_D_A]|uniref:hypothetical protein n=1 Tax=Microcoleus sp. PH2017_25_DOB_D_A TaxID=2798835 RepID=UPI0025D86F7E
MQPFSLKLFKFNCEVRSGFLFPLAFCFLSVVFYIPPHFSPKNEREAPGFRHGEESGCDFSRLELNSIGIA